MKLRLKNTNWLVVITLMTWATFLLTDQVAAQYALPDLKVRGRPIRQPVQQPLQNAANLYPSMAKSHRPSATMKSIAKELPSSEPLPLQNSSPPPAAMVIVPPQVTNAPPAPYAEHEMGPQGEAAEYPPTCGPYCGRFGFLAPIFHPIKYYFGPHPERSTGMGQPLGDGSWLNRPVSLSANVGIFAGDTLINDNVRQQTDLYGDLRLGWDFDHYWGTEVRVGKTEMGLQEIGTLATLDKADVYLWDVQLMYYYWGDSRWRPYTSIGFGIIHYDFDDNVGRRIVATPFTLPFAAGIKCRLKPGVVIRAEIRDNLAFGAGTVQTMHNLTVTVGAEIRFGGRHRSYWPWNADSSTWTVW